VEWWGGQSPGKAQQTGGFSRAPAPGLLGAHKQKWQSLPQEVRSAIMSVSGLAGAKFWGRNFFDTAEQGV